MIPCDTNLSSITKPLEVKNIKRSKRKVNRIANQFRYSDRKNFRRLEIDQESNEILNGRVVTSSMPNHLVSMKSTPNGEGYFNFHLDRAGIAHNKEVCTNLLKYLKVNFSGDVDAWLEGKLQPYRDLKPKENGSFHTAKISLTSVGGKTKFRIFAILDSLSQSVLQPLHNDLMRTLKSIPEDCTFDHNYVSSIAQKQWRENHRYYGFADLSDATDRVWAVLYQKILNKARPLLGDTWLALFDRDFTIGRSVSDN